MKGSITAQQACKQPSALDVKAAEMLEARQLIEDLKVDYERLGIEAGFQSVQVVLATPHFAVDFGYLQHRITTTSAYLQDAVLELLRPTHLQPPTISKASSSPQIETQAEDLERVSLVNSQHHRRSSKAESSGQKKSILKRSSRGKRDIHEVDSRRNERITQASMNRKEVSIPEETSHQQDTKAASRHRKPHEEEPKQVSEDEGGSQMSESQSCGSRQQELRAAEERPKFDAFLETRVTNPAVILRDNMLLDDSILPTCLTALSETEVAVGTASGCLMITDLRSSRWIDLGVGGPIISLKALGRRVLCCIDSSVDNLCLVDIDKPDASVFLKGHSRGVADGTWFDAERRLVTVGKDGKVIMWRCQPLAIMKILKVSNLPLNSVTSLPTGGTIVTGGDDTSIRVFAVTLEALVAQRSISDSAAITRVDGFYQNTKFVASANIQGQVKIWDVTTGDCLKVVATGGLVQSILKITSQSGCADQTEIKLLIFVKGHDRPLIANVNEEEKLQPTGLSPVPLCGSGQIGRLVEIFTCDPITGFSFLAITETDIEGRSLDRYKFLPNHP